MAGAPKGNQNAAKAKVWSDAIRKYAIQNGCIEAAAQKLCELAMAGDMAALKELGDRLEGKAVQSIANDGEGGFIVKIVS